MKLYIVDGQIVAKAPKVEDLAFTAYASEKKVAPEIIRNIHENKLSLSCLFPPIWKVLTAFLRYPEIRQLSHCNKRCLEDMRPFKRYKFNTEYSWLMYQFLQQRQSTSHSKVRKLRPVSTQGKAFKFRNFSAILNSNLLDDFSCIMAKLYLQFHNRNLITDISCLAVVNEIYFYHCRNVRDVSSLGSVQSLTIKGGHSLTDVSALGSLKLLRMMSCAVTDVSALGLVHHLMLVTLRITDVSALGSVYHLEIHNCELVTDVSSLAHVHHLHLSICNGITDVSSLCTVHHLEIEECDMIKDASSLIKSVPHLSIKKCKRLSDYVRDVQ